MLGHAVSVPHRVCFHTRASAVPRRGAAGREGERKGEERGQGERKLPLSEEVDTPKGGKRAAEQHEAGHARAAELGFPLAIQLRGHRVQGSWAVRGQGSGRAGSRVRPAGRERGRGWARVCGVELRGASGAGLGAARSSTHVPSLLWTRGSPAREQRESGGNTGRVRVSVWVRSSGLSVEGLGWRVQYGFRSGLGGQGLGV